LLLSLGHFERRIIGTAACYERCTTAEAQRAQSPDYVRAGTCNSTGHPQTLDKFAVPAAELAEVVAIVESTRRSIIAAS